MTLPLISCICPSANRGAFLAQSVRYFLDQDYPNKELIILEDGDEMHWHNEKGVIYHYSMGYLSIGVKRNLACQLAHGDIICHWDDDDYYGPQRLYVQAEPILRARADVSAMHMELLFDVSHGILAHCPAVIHKSLFGHDVRSSTLMYWADTAHPARYTDSSRGEDVALLDLLLLEGKRLAAIHAPYHYISIQHDGNITPALDTCGWERAALSEYLTYDEQAFYHQFQQ